MWSEKWVFEIVISAVISFLAKFYTLTGWVQRTMK